MKRTWIAVVLSVTTAMASAIAPITQSIAFADTVYERELDAFNEESLTQFLADLDRAETQEEVNQILYSFLSPEEIRALEREYSVPFQQLVEPAGISFRSPQDFLECMANKATDDIKGLFQISAVSVAIGNKDYQKAAKEIVEHLAKQGIKRNIAGVVFLLGVWGWNCRGSW